MFVATCRHPDRADFTPDEQRLLGFGCDQSTAFDRFALAQFQLHYYPSDGQWLPHPAIDPRDTEQRLTQAFQLIQAAYTQFRNSQNNQGIRAWPAKT